MFAIVGCSQLVTLRGPARPRSGAEMLDLGIVENGVILFEDGRIVECGPGNLVTIPPGTEIISAGGRVVMPGFVDAHTHPVFAGNRADEYEQRIEGATYAEIAARGGGIRSTVRRTRMSRPPGTPWWLISVRR